MPRTHSADRRHVPRRARRARPHARARSTRPRRKTDTVQAPKFEVDPMWPKPLPNNWVIGRRSASPSTRRITSGSCIASTRCRPTEVGRGAESADRRRAAGARRRSSSSTRTARCCVRGAARAQGYRLAGVESRPLRRSQGHRLDGRQRRHRLAGAEVHAGRQVRRAVRQARARTRAATTRRTSAGRRRSSSIRGERGLHRRRLRQQARRRHRRRHRQVQALLGRVRQQAGRHESRARTTRMRRRRSSSAHPCTARICRSTTSSTSAIVRTTGCRCSRARASS